MAVWLEAMAGLLAACGALDAAAQVLGAVDTLRRRGGFPIHNHERTQLQPTVDAVTGRLSAEDFARAWAHGTRRSLPDIVDLAYAEAASAMSGRRDAAQPDGPEARFAAAGLTRRELDVARFLVVRLSDKEIAERLAISPRTVSTHVAVILDKLGVHSRRDVARLASEPDYAAHHHSQEMHQGRL
jgi:DNA-binding CsgD family transcriptional regulator